MVKTIRKTSKKRYIAILCVMLLSCFAISGLVLADNGDPAPGIDVQGDTSFGSVDITVGAVDRTFTIENTGTATLNLTDDIDVYRAPLGTPVPTPHFTVTQPSDMSIDAGESTTFTVRFDPTTTGDKNAFIEIANDSDENPYIFQISGTGVDLGHDASLSDLLVDGTTVDEFDPDTTTYNVELPAGTAIVPAVTFTLNDSAASADVTDAATLPGTATVEVTAEDGETTRTYTINFTLPSGEIEVPDVATLSATNVEETSATLRGQLTTDGDFNVTEYGFYWSDTAGVDESDDELVAGTEDLAQGDTFTESLTGLAVDQTYFYVAYIKYTDGIEVLVLGDEEEFTTRAESDLNDDGELDVVTDRAKVTNKDKATVYAYVEIDEDDWDDDIYDIYKYGFFYGTDRRDVEEVEDLSDFDDFDSLDVEFEAADDEDYDDRDEEFQFSSDLRNLEDKEDYYFRAFIEYENTDDGLIYYSLGKVKHFDLGDYRKSSGGSSATRPVVIPQPVPLNPSVFTIGSTTYLLDGSYLVMDAAPYIKNSRTYLPIRYVAYAMGLTDADIQWDEATQMVTLTKGTTTVSLVIGNQIMFQNGTPIMMDVAPEITNDRTCLPVAWVASAFGHTAVWDPLLQTVTIR